VQTKRRRPDRTRRRPADSGTLPQFDREYWLAHCEGFRVEGDAGRLGFVEEIRSDDGRNPVLVIRAGLLGRRLLFVPAAEVAFIVPRAQRIWLRSPVDVIETRIAS
jgi:hypothetical protein